MEKFSTGYEIPKYFGDFGGNYSERDTVAPVNQRIAEELQAYFTTEDFANKFDEIFAVVYPQAIEIQKFDFQGKQIYVAPSLAKYFIMTGYLTMAMYHGRTKAVMGTFSKEMAQVFVSSCKKLNLFPKVCLSRALCADTALVEELKAEGAEVDDFSCVKMLDFPNAYINFDEGMGFEVVPIEANYGIFPRVSITTAFATLYGQELKKLIDFKPELAAVAIKTGTEAAGVLDAFIGEITTATIEETVTKEFHVDDAGAFTLSTRGTKDGEANTSIAPKLAYWWHRAKVARLGCDKLLPVDTGAYGELEVSDGLKRALALIDEEYEAKTILLVEEK